MADSKNTGTVLFVVRALRVCRLACIVPGPHKALAVAQEFLAEWLRMQMFKGERFSLGRTVGFPLISLGLQRCVCCVMVRERGRAAKMRG